MHVPVMKDEAIKLLNVKKGGLYIDCTFGEGGHSKAILEKGGIVLAMDRDSLTETYAKIIKNSYPESFFWVHSSFLNLEEVWQKFCFPMKLDGCIFDLGFSSNQIEDPARGFSFLKDSSLDMRYDTSKNSKTALDLINSLEENSLYKIFLELGEEPLAFKMAQKICNFRRNKKINSCYELLSILNEFNNFNNKHFATKIFQALRIYVNDELYHIKEGVKSALKLLKFYGRIVVISFHSLEDRLVKKFFSNKNLILPSTDEIERNPRSRSAKMRWMINLEHDC